MLRERRRYKTNRKGWSMHYELIVECSRLCANYRRDVDARVPKVHQESGNVPHGDAFPGAPAGPIARCHLRLERASPSTSMGFTRCFAGATLGTLTLSVGMQLPAGGIIRAKIDKYTQVSSTSKVQPPSVRHPTETSTSIRRRMETPVSP